MKALSFAFTAVFLFLAASLVSSDVTLDEMYQQADKNMDDLIINVDKTEINSKKIQTGFASTDFLATEFINAVTGLINASNGLITTIFEIVKYAIGDSKNIIFSEMEINETMLPETSEKFNNTLNKIKEELDQNILQITDADALSKVQASATNLKLLADYMRSLNKLTDVVVARQLKQMCCETPPKDILGTMFQALTEFYQVTNPLPTNLDFIASIVSATMKHFGIILASCDSIISPNLERDYSQIAEEYVKPFLDLLNDPSNPPTYPPPGEVQPACTTT